MTDRVLPNLEPADILLSRSNSRASRVIVAVQTLQNGMSRASHAALVINDTECIEAVWHGLTITPLKRYDHIDNIRIVRLKNISHEQRLEIVVTLVARLGEPYGWSSLILLALDSMVSFLIKREIKWFSSLLKITRFAVCSQAVAWAYEQVLKRKVFGTDWKSVTPDMIDEEAKEPEWETVYQSPTW